VVDGFVTETNIGEIVGALKDMDEQAEAEKKAASFF